MAARTMNGSALRPTSAFDTRLGLRGLLRLGVAACVCLPAGLSAQDVTLPQGANVASGAVTVARPDAATMTITQGTDKAVVNWDSFSIGTGGHVDVRQPSAQSSILNRVTGDTTSAIHGRLTANGQVQLVNPNGIYIGPNGVVETQGFVASTLSIEDGDFNAGRLAYRGKGDSATVENAGRVTIGRAGYAALLGGKVRNSGIVIVPFGRIGFAAGERVTLDLSGDQFLEVALPSGSVDDEALIDNSGEARAEGGLIEMRAATARQAVRNAINLSGVAEASSVSVRGGTIVLGGGSGGRVSVTGQVKARAKPARATLLLDRSKRPPQRGGNVSISGVEIALDGAEIDASGDAGGGLIRIGGDFAGAGEMPRADVLSVDVDSLISADSLEDGDGGRIVLWSDLSTDFAGKISARGGDAGGDGGFVEVSGKVDLRYSGMSDRRAPMGAAGMLWLDPVNIQVDTVSTSGTTLLESVLESDLASGPVTLDTFDEEFLEAGDITINADIDWTSGNQLALLAEGDIVLNGDLNGSGATVMFDAAGDMTLNGAVTSNAFQLNTAGAFSGTAGTITPTLNGDVNVSSFLILNGDWFQVSADLADFSAANFTLRSGGTFMRAEGGDGSEASPYLLQDVYGLQGIESGILAFDSYRLVSDIDASGTRDWSNSFNAGFQPISGYYGEFDGDGFEISGLFVAPNSGEGLPDAGLFGIVNSSAVISDLTVSGADVRGRSVGILAADNFGTIRNSHVSGAVLGVGPSVGGLVGTNSGVIEDSSSQAGVLATGAETFSFLSVGGLVGENDIGLIERSHATGNVTVANIGELSGIDAGGFVGYEFSPGDSETINDSFATGDVSVTNNAQVDISVAAGGFVGAVDGDINQSYSTGSVTTSGNVVAEEGGFAGALLSGQATTNFWDVTTSGQTTSAVGIGLTTAEFQDTDNFLSEADVQGWDFGTVWAPSDTGFYPQNYSTAPVVFAVPDPLTVQYGLTETATTTGGVSGGPARFLSDEAGDTLDTSALFDSLTFSGRDAGAQTFNIDTGSLTSTDGVVYRVVSRQASADVSRAPLTITPDDADKDYGVDLTFLGTEFTTTPGALFFSDTVDSVTLDSAGAAATAQVTGSPFAITASAAEGTGISNYDITFEDGSLTIVPAPLTVTAEDASKAYGDDLTFLGTEFTTVGTLFNGDALESVALNSDGAGAGATVSEGPYAIVASGPVGRGLGNYVFAFETGTLTVDPLSLTITAEDQSKSYGEELTFLGTEFTTLGMLVNGDTIDTVTLSSVGAAAGATVDAGPYDIIASAPVGTGVGNYAFSFETGTLSVDQAQVTVTPDDMSKPFGVELDLGTTAFTVSEGTLVNGDSIDAVTLASLGTPSDADVGTYDITASAAVGTGVENYNITFDTGLLTVSVADLIVTADDIRKTYGMEFTFLGTEFTLSDGLRPGDSLDSVTLTSLGAAAESGVDSYTIVASDAVGTGLENYTIAFLPGTLSVDPAPLTIAADNQSKTEGESFEFMGTEFSVSEFAVDGDAVTSVSLFSEGSFAEASASGSPFTIEIAEPVGTGLDNYEITLVPGLFTLDAEEAEEIEVPPTFVGFPPPNPQDSVDTDVSETDEDESAGRRSARTRSVRQIERAAAEETLGEVEVIAESLTIGADSCGQGGGGVGRYLACLSDSLNAFAGELDDIATELPPGMQNVARIVQDARVQVDRARARAQTRLATATTDAERQAIRADAVSEARSALATAATEIRKSISLVRADDPELANVQRATVTRVAAAVDNVGIQLARATGL